MNPSTPQGASALKQLTLIRHGEAGRASNGRDDLSRVLTASGEQMAVQMGGVLKEMGLKPDLIVVSHAPRALKTAQMIAPMLEYDPAAIKTEPNIYRTRDIGFFFEYFQQVDESVNQLILVGHNPYISELVRALDPNATPMVMDLCAMVHFELTVDHWALIDPTPRTPCARRVAHRVPDV